MTLDESVINSITTDNLKLFQQLVADNKEVLNYQYGIFPVVSLCFLYNADKLINYLLPQYKNQNNYVKKPEYYPARKLFRSLLKGRACIPYDNKPSFIEPFEIVLLKGEYKLFLSLTNQYGVKSQEAENRILRLIEILKLNYHSKQQSDGQLIYYYKKPIDIKKIKRWSIILVCIIIAVLTPLITMLSLWATVTVVDGDNTQKISGFIGNKATINSIEQEGYSLVGYSSTADGKTPFSGKFTQKQQTIYVVRQPKQYSLVISVDQVNTSKSVKFGEPLELLTPAKEDYLFDYWQCDGKPFNNKTMPARSLTLTAVFRYWGKGIESSPYLIKQSQDLLLIANDVDGYYSIEADISFDQSFLGISDFYGTLEGNNHTISINNTLCVFENLNVSATVKNLDIVCNIEKLEADSILDYGGIFAKSSFARIENVNVNGNVVFELANKNNVVFAPLVGICGVSSIIENCTAELTINPTMSIYEDTQKDLFIGGLVGENNGRIINCKNQGNQFGNCDYGGIAAINNVDGIIEQCKFMGNVIVTNSTTMSTEDNVWTTTVAGIAAINYGSVSQCEIESTIKATVLYSAVSIGGIVGQNFGVIDNCKNTSEECIGYSGYYCQLGGIVGNSFGTISLCENLARISGNNGYNGYSGGILGVSEQGSVISSSTNNGTVESSRTSGGIVGLLFGKVENCLNKGNVVGASARTNQAESPFAGGIVALAEQGSIIDGCVSMGDVSIVRVSNAQKTACGGIAAYCLGSITNCLTVASVRGYSIENNSCQGLVVGVSFSAVISDCHYLTNNNGLQTAYNVEKSEIMAFSTSEQSQGCVAYTQIQSMKGISTILDKELDN